MSARALGFTVHLYRERGLGIENANDVARIFSRNAGPARIQIAQKALKLATDENGDLPWHDTFMALRDVRERDKIPDSDFIYLLTRTPNELNWYAVEDENCMRNGFGHVGDFNWVTTSPPSVVSAHYVLKAIFNALVDEAGLNWRSLWHDKPRGCFYDFCEEKQQLNLKLRTADICGDCMQVFKEIPIPESLIAQTVRIMEESRLTALNTALFLPRPNSFDAWPFPVAVTRHSPHSLAQIAKCGPHPHRVRFDALAIRVATLQ